MIQPSAKQVFITILSLMPALTLRQIFRAAIALLALQSPILAQDSGNSPRRPFRAQHVFDLTRPIIFRDSFQSGQFGRWNFSEDDRYRLMNATPERISIVDAPGLPAGEKAVRFFVPRGPDSFRAEISLPSEKGFNERWYGQRVFIPEEWVFDPGKGNDIVMQWHAVPGNGKPTYPNLEISIGNDRWFIRQSFGSAQTKPTRTNTKLDELLKRGVWVSWVIHAKWSPNDDGLLQIWKDAKVVFERKGPNVYGTIGVDYTPYLKTGIYHPEWHLDTESKRSAFEKEQTEAVSKVVYVTNCKIGDERARYDDVAPPVAAAAERAADESRAMEQSQTRRQPNIIVIMTDEHNAGVMGCAGDKIARTPNLDALAARGVIFGAHYCSSPICTPSRQSFTTGKYVSGHSVWSNTQGVPEGTPSLPRIMNAAGYDSYLDGKMHYKGGMTHGFSIIEEKTGTIKPPKEVSDFNAENRKGKPRRRLPAGQFPDNGSTLGEEFEQVGTPDKMDTFIDVPRRDNAIKFLRERPSDAKPFFLTIGFIAPHYPLVAPAEYLAHFQGKVPPPEIPDGYLDTLPLNYKHLRNDRKFERVPPETARLGLEAYYARVEWIDHQIGQVLDALKSSPFAENTIVIYTSDHGENMGEHGLWWKNCLYDCGARVPLIVSCPARWKGGQQRSGACGVLDLVQTIAALGGAKVPQDWKGSSMLPWLDDAAFAWKDQAVSEYYAGYTASGIAMIRQGDWKYVYHTRADETHGPERELYQLRDDPKELHNLSGDPTQQARIAAMHEALVKETGEDPEKTEARWRAGDGPR